MKGTIAQFIEHSKSNGIEFDVENFEDGVSTYFIPDDYVCIVDVYTIDFVSNCITIDTKKNVFVFTTDIDSSVTYSMSVTQEVNFKLFKRVI